MATPASGAARNLAFLDGLRGLAAFYVMLGHARWLLWEGYSEGYLHHPQLYSGVGKALVLFSSVFRYGHAAVMFFFVLSGFVIHLRNSQQIANEELQFSSWQFMKRRAWRMCPPVYTALALTAVLDAVGRGCGFAPYFRSTVYPIINESITSSTGLWTCLGNALFLMDAYVPVFGSNGPLWSLKYEWWFYVLYPVFLALNRRSMALAAGVLGLLWSAAFLGVLCHVLLLEQVLLLMGVWWLGVILADVHTGRIPIRMRWIAPWSLLVLILPLRPQIGLLADMLWGLGFAGVLAACFCLAPSGRCLRGLAALRPLGEMSFTLYLIHLPLFVLLSGWLMSRNADGLLPAHFGWVALGIGAATALAYGLHFIVERPFTRQRR